MVNLFWLILFMAGTAFVWLRKIDGSGAIQTPEAKFISFIVLLIAFAFPFIIQSVWLFINLSIRYYQKKEKH